MEGWNPKVSLDGTPATWEAHEMGPFSPPCNDIFTFRYFSERPLYTMTNKVNSIIPVGLRRE